MMSSLELEVLYSPSKWSKRLSSNVILQKHFEYIKKNSADVRRCIKCDLNIAYGTGDREKIDIIGTDLSGDAPIFIHIHGCYQEESITQSNNIFIGKQLHKNNIKSIFIGYEPCPNVTVKELLENLGIALVKCLEYAKKCKSKSVYLSGHSAGAHAIPALFENFINTLPNEDQKLIKGAFILCGLYDLIPITKMSANILLKLSEETAKELSPLYQNITSENTTFHVIAAENDSPAFIKQSIQFFNKLRDGGVRSSFYLIQQVDHFDLIEKLTEENFELTRYIIKNINGC